MKAGGGGFKFINIANEPFLDRHRNGFIGRYHLPGPEVHIAKNIRIAGNGVKSLGIIRGDPGKFTDALGVIGNNLPEGLLALDPLYRHSIAFPVRYKLIGLR